MPNYQDSKIYKLVGNGKVYVGSTTQALCKRKTAHISDFKLHNNCSSREIVTDAAHYIELIEYFPCNTKEELHKRERYYIEQIDCVNKCIPGRTNQEYYEANKDKIKVYQAANKDKIREYREATKDKWKAYQKAYYEAKKASNIVSTE
jgi:hypothetical protein